jgi:hypothetical protein
MSDREWIIDDYLERLYPRCSEKLSNHFTASSRQNAQDIEVTDELLYESYVFMANIVKTYGEQFLPIFERLHSEIKIREEKRSILEAAMEVSKADSLVQS